MKTSGIPWHLIWWRALLLIIAFSLGIAAFRLGAVVSERPGITHADLLTQIYCTLSLFALGGTDLGTPVSGPATAQLMLWVAYFMCPAITAIALIEGALLLLKPARMGLRNLVVLAGNGEMVLHYLRQLHAGTPRQNVLLVVPEGCSLNIDELKQVHPRLHMIVGDVARKATLNRMHLKHASRVMLLTEDDLTNLAAAHRMRDEHLCDCPVVAHVADLVLLRDLRNVPDLAPIRMFNAFESAATNVVKDQIFAAFRNNSEVEVLVIAGFNRFGQSLLQAVQTHAPDAFTHVVLVDLNATASLHCFREQCALEKIKVACVNADISDPQVWSRVQEHVQIEGKRPVIVLCTRDEVLNLHVAMMQSRHWNNALTLVRTLHRSKFAAMLGKVNGFSVIDSAAQIATALREVEA